MGSGGASSVFLVGYLCMYRVETCSAAPHARENTDAPTDAAKSSSPPPPSCVKCHSQGLLLIRPN